MKRLCCALLHSSLVVAQHAFNWPPDRSPDANQTAPCGAVAAVGKRAEFPLKNGRISLVAQEVSWDARIAISHLSEPKSNADFSELPETSFLRDDDRSSTCVSIADASPTVRAGDNATIQLSYSIGSAEFFACADIVYVEPARFKQPSVSCFAASEAETEDDVPWFNGFPGPADDGDDARRLPGDAVAGIVVAVVVAVILMALLGLYLYRRKCQRHRMQRQLNSVRKIPWDEQAASARPTAPANVKMRDLS
ncbi:hypothetical protein CP532_0311 [Ophiocordyceps camponoti-leonardi (nom. inval.)]|nr:hypothetical protein CP532_0311 [Ophiocordyceps camponoti-leonardi (nom. inval.)]